MTRNIANMDIQYKVEDASEFIPTVAWLGLREASVMDAGVGVIVLLMWFCGGGLNDTAFRFWG